MPNAHQAPRERANRQRPKAAPTAHFREAAGKWSATITADGAQNQFLFNLEPTPLRTNLGLNNTPDLMLQTFIKEPNEDIRYLELRPTFPNESTIALQFGYNPQQGTEISLIVWRNT